MNILIVDDEMLVRTGLRTLLAHGMEAFSFAGDARSGVEALELIPLVAPVIVITDLVMPEMTGLELMEAVRNKGYLAEFIVLTSHRDFEFARRAVEMGAIDYLLKHELERDTLIPILERARARIEEKALNRIRIPIPSTEEKLPHRERHLVLVRVNKVKDAQAKRGSESLSSQIVSLINQILGRDVETSLKEVHDGVWMFGVRGLRGDLHRHGARIVHHLAHTMNLKVRVGISLPGSAGNTNFFDLQFCEPGSVLVQRSDVKEKHRTNGLNAVREVRKRIEFALDHRDNHSVRGAIEEFRRMLTDQLIPRIEAIRETTQLMAKFLAHGTGTELSLQDIYEAAGLDDLLSPLYAALEELVAHPMHATSEVPEEIFRVRDLVQREYIRHISLDEAAWVAGKSPTYFSDFFRHHQGIGFVEYVNRVRVGAAAEILLCSSDTIAAVASAVGFPNEKYFSRTFKRIIGVPPGSFRSGNRAPYVGTESTDSKKGTPAPENRECSVPSSPWKLPGYPKYPRRIL